MVSDKLNLEILNKISNQIPKATIIQFDELPHYDLFLSQVIDFLNVKLDTAEFTSNIVQNYIKNEVISKPEEGKKKGYTKMHLIQLILVSYMRPVLTTEEIKKVLQLAFNDINNHQDDIISWELAYKVFTRSQNEAIDNLKYADYLNDEALNAEITEFNLNNKEKERIRVFLSVMKLIAEASTIKKLVQNIVGEFGDTLME